MVNGQIVLALLSNIKNDIKSRKDFLKENT